MPDRSPVPPVLFVAGEYPPDVGGLADYTALLRSGLERRGVTTRVLARARPGPVEPDTVLRDVRSWNAGALLHLARRTPHAGIVHVQYQAAAFDLRGEICLTPALLRALRPDVRVATTFHDVRVPYLFPKAGPVRLAAVRAMARFSHAVLAADLADLAALGGPSPRHYLVPIGSNVVCSAPPGYDRDRFRADLGLQPGDLAVGYFGFLNASKGLDTLRAAFDRVAVAEPRAKLLLLGGAAGASDATDAPTAATFAARLGALSGRVLRPGYLPADRLSAYLLAADVALLPYADGASMRRGSLLACAEHGLPIVTTAGSGLVAPLAGAVLALPPGDAPGLADAVLRVAHEPELRGRLRAGSAAIAQAASWDGIADRHLAIYAGLSPARG